ncbi:hypothetical protein SASPL_150740 [Salvia splendens]|uniref:Pectin acetylesterase n=1 Tax=Salvia splendens TaxID=180675 RepID=A0A8X8W733_SALSN|nr:hypothetical protein SASPL_150740 [Salvia splendens]
MGIARHLLWFLMWALALTTQVYGVRDRNITLLESAVAKGAVCLDGTPPAYIYSKGYGEGANNWIVYIQGGGWCISWEDCHNRSMSHLGSSTRMMAVYTYYPPEMDGMLDDNATYNPRLYFLIFTCSSSLPISCDESSFMSNIDQEINFKGKVIYFRGVRIYDAMMEELFLNKGIADAQNVILTGLANLLPTSCTTRMNPTLYVSCKPSNIIYFRATFIHTLKSLDNSSSIGYFVHSCYAHGHVFDEKTWTSSSLARHNVLANKGIGQAIGDWYFNHSSFQEIDMQNDLPRNCDVILSQTAFNQLCMDVLQHA